MVDQSSVCLDMGSFGLKFESTVFQSCLDLSLRDGKKEELDRLKCHDPNQNWHN